MDPVKQLHDEILAKVGEYYRLAHKPVQDAPFDPEKSRVNYGGRVYDENEMKNLADAALEFWLTGGRYARKFESDLAALLHVKYALLVNSGSSANLLAFSALTSPLLGEKRLRRGDEVITVACGFPTTVGPIIQYGAVPVFVDVDPATANLDPALLEGALSSRTRAVMAAHTLGNPFDIRSVLAFCRKHDLFLIEDNCDALGSTYDGKFTGTWGHIGTSSFYPPHHLTMGEGGAVYTDDPLLRKILLSIRDWGRECWCDPGRDNTCGCRFTKQFGKLPVGYDHKYVYSHFGYNLKATDLQAAIGCAQLEKLAAFTEQRKRNYRFLREGLADIDSLRFMEKYPESDPSWFGFLMTVKEGASFTRNQLVEYLEKNRIQTRNLFAGNLTKHPCFDSLTEGVDYRIAGSLEHTDYIMDHTLWIGLYPGMIKEKLDYMIEKIHTFIQMEEQK